MKIYLTENGQIINNVPLHWIDLSENSTDMEIETRLEYLNTRYLRADGTHKYIKK